MQEYFTVKRQIFSGSGSESLSESKSLYNSNSTVMSLVSNADSDSDSDPDSDDPEGRIGLLCACLLFIHTEFVDGFHHSPQIGHVSFVDAGAAGQNVTAAGCAVLDQLSAVFLDLRACAGHHDR